MVAFNTMIEVSHFQKPIR